MSLRRFKQKFAKATSLVSGAVGSAVDSAKATAGDLLDTSIDLEKAKEQLVDDLDKGIRIFDEIGLPQDIGDNIQEEIAEFAMTKLEEAWRRSDRKPE